MNRGTLYGVGVGPGDPELLTLKAARIIRACAVIAIPQKDPDTCLSLSIAQGALPEITEKPLIAIDMPMTKDADALLAAYAQGAAQVISELDAGRDVAFLTLGDPTVYSTYLYIHERVASAGYPTVIVPGVTSFCAAAAALGTSLCENSEELHIVPGTYHATEALDYPGTSVFMKNKLGETLSEVRARGLSAQMAQCVGLPNEQLYHQTADIPDEASYYSVLIVKNPNERVTRSPER